MKLLRIETLLQSGNYASSSEWQKLRQSIQDAVRSVDWPPGSGKFTIYPQSGKKRGEGNGVRPIKRGLMQRIDRDGWQLEEPLEITAGQRPGKLDAVYYGQSGIAAIEWETGNISSSHRAINKMALGMLTGKLQAGILIVPSRRFYRFLTDRIGNFQELSPYFPLWKSLPVESGVLEVFEVEHDDTSRNVARIPKSTDGRALG